MFHARGETKRKRRWFAVYLHTMIGVVKYAGKSGDGGKVETGDRAVL